MIFTPTESQLQEIKSKNAFIFEKGGHKFYLRKPNMGEFRKFDMAVSGNPQNQFDAAHDLAQACVLFPTVEDLEKIFDDAPGLVKEVGGELYALASNSLKAEAKKL